MLFPSIGEMTRYTGWWFQTFLMFHMECHPSHCHIFQDGHIAPPSSIWKIRLMCLFSSDFRSRTSDGKNEGMNSTKTRSRSVEFLKNQLFYSDVPSGLRENFGKKKAFPRHSQHMSGCKAKHQWQVTSDIQVTGRLHHFWPGLKHNTWVTDLNLISTRGCGDGRQVFSPWVFPWRFDPRIFQDNLKSGASCAELGTELAHPSTIRHEITAFCAAWWLIWGKWEAICWQHL